MRPLTLSLTLAVLGLFAAPYHAPAQGIRPLPPGPAFRPLPPPLPDLTITSVTEVGRSAWVIIKNRGGRTAWPQLVRLRVFDRGRLIGSYLAAAPAIPAGYSRAVLIRTDLLLSRPGLVLMVRADATNAVFERNERNNTFVKATRPLPYTPRLTLARGPWFRLPF